MSDEITTTRTRSADEDRFYVALAKHGLFQALGTDESAPIRSLSEAFILAAALGFAHGSRIPLGPRQHVGFIRTFDEKVGLPLLEAIAIAETGDPGAVADRGLVMTIAEEYANSGVDMLVDLDRGDRDRTVVALAGVLLGEEPEPLGGDRGPLPGVSED